LNDFQARKTVIFFSDRDVKGKPRDKRATEIDYLVKYAIFSTACSILYKYCAPPISKHLHSKKD